MLPNDVVTRHLGWLESLNLVTKQDESYFIPIENGEFEVGKTYSRWFIHDVLKGGRYKGIATPSEHPLIFIFTGDAGSTYGYQDEFLEDDTFLYTGEGTEGEMTMDGGNEAIRSHNANGDDLHLFENTDLPWISTYLASTSTSATAGRSYPTRTATCETRFGSNWLPSAARMLNSRPHRLHSRIKNSSRRQRRVRQQGHNQANPRRHRPTRAPADPILDPISSANSRCESRTAFARAVRRRPRFEPEWRPLPRGAPPHAPK